MPSPMTRSWSPAAPASLQRRWRGRRRRRVRVVGRPGFDFDRPETHRRVPSRAASPPLVINAAAWTAVDAAESEPERGAMRANRDGPARLAALCADAGIPLIHISTDYVFDGDKGAPYVETDPTGPTGVYGATKLAGEQAVLAACPRAIVLRTSWVYSATGKNFVRTMLNLAQTPRPAARRRRPAGLPDRGPRISPASCSPSPRRLRDGWRDEYGGVFHAAGSGGTTWHGLAEAVFDEAARHGARKPDGRSHHHRRLPDPGQAPRRQPARLRQARTRVRPAPAGRGATASPASIDADAQPRAERRKRDAARRASCSRPITARASSRPNSAVSPSDRARLAPVLARRRLHRRDVALMQAFAAEHGAGRVVHVDAPGHLGADRQLLGAAARGRARPACRSPSPTRTTSGCREKLAWALAALGAIPGARPLLQPPAPGRRSARARSARPRRSAGRPASRPRSTQNIATGCTVVLNPAAAALVAGSHARRRHLARLVELPRRAGGRRPHRRRRPRPPCCIASTAATSSAPRRPGCSAPAPPCSAAPAPSWPCCAPTSPPLLAQSALLTPQSRATLALLDQALHAGAPDPPPRPPPPRPQTPNPARDRAIPLLVPDRLTRDPRRSGAVLRSAMVHARGRLLAKRIPGMLTPTAQPLSPRIGDEHDDGTSLDRSGHAAGASGLLLDGPASGSRASPVRHQAARHDRRHAAR